MQDMDKSFVIVTLTLLTMLQSSRTQDTALQFIGCYKDDVTNRAMSIITQNPYTTASVLGCIDFCRDNKYTFSGLKAASECHCGEDFTKHGTSTNCNSKCTDGSGDICGGVTELSVYSTCPKGLYGTNCGLPCPDSCITLSKRVCHIITGKCCEGSQSIPYCNFFDLEECGKVDGDPREGISNMDQTAGNWFNLFTSLAFPVDAEVHEIEYYTRRGGDVQFVSIWRRLQDTEHMMVAKLELSPTEAGPQKVTLSTKDRIYVQRGDIIALHYPSSNVWANMIPYSAKNFLPEGITVSDLDPVASFNESGENWTPGYTHIMPLDDSMLRTAAISLKYSCIKVCDDGYHGQSCSPCGNCKDMSPCHHKTGHCENGCSNGYQGLECTEKCDAGYYGEKCAHSCGNCKDDTICGHIDGECDSGCHVGYKGFTCHEACPDNTYGFGCQPCSVHCKVLPCQKFSQTGSCFGNCDPGYTGDNCTEECKPGKYGPKCSLTCYRNCLGSCDIVNGVCKDGCINGWTGQMCDTKDSKHTNQLTIAIVTGCVVITIVAIISATVVHIRQAKAKRYQPSPKLSKPESPDIAKTDGNENIKEGVTNPRSGQVNECYEMMGEGNDSQPQYEPLKQI